MSIATMVRFALEKENMEAEEFAKGCLDVNQTLNVETFKSNVNSPCPI